MNQQPATTTREVGQNVAPANLSSQPSTSLVAISGTASLEPCEWRLASDGFTDKLNALADGFQAAVDKLNEGVQRFEDSLVGKFLNIMKWTNPALMMIDFTRKQLMKAMSKVDDLIRKIAEIIPKLAAPWNIREIGRQMVKGLDRKNDDFVDSLDLKELKSRKTWEGEGAELFRERAAEQEEHGVETHEYATTFSSAMESLGNDAVSSTESFIFSALGGSGAAGIGKAGVDIAKSITAAAKSALNIWILVIVLIQLVIAFIKFQREKARMLDQFAYELSGEGYEPWSDPVNN